MTTFYNDILCPNKKRSRCLYMDMKRLPRHISGKIRKYTVQFFYMN